MSLSDSATLEFMEEETEQTWQSRIAQINRLIGAKVENILPVSTVEYERAAAIGQEHFSKLPGPVFGN